MRILFLFLLMGISTLSAKVLVEVSFREGEEAVVGTGLVSLPGSLPGTGLRPTPHRADQGVPQALVRDLREEPQWPDGRLQIARNEVEQGMKRVFAPSVPFDPSEQVLVMRVTTFSDATTGGTNSIGVRLWVQHGLGPNEHRERMELSTHFNAHQRGSRQVYPNAYYVRDGWETWAMPEGTNSRRAGIYYRLGAEGRNEEIRGPQAVPQGYYWTWQGLQWPKGWTPPVGGGLYEPPPSDATHFPGNGLYTTTAVWARTERPLPGDPHRFSSRVDVMAPRGEGRVLLEAPLPEQIDEVRLILRSESPGEGRDWLMTAGRSDDDPLFLGVADMKVALLSRADVNLDGLVDQADWEILLQHAGKTDALHGHGDLTGDGRVGINDGFFLAARMAEQSSDQALPSEQWRAWQDSSGQVHLRVPVGGQLYGWQMENRTDKFRPDHLQAVFSETAMREQTPQRIGEMDLRHPVRTEGEEVLDLNFGPILAGTDTILRMRIQAGLGQEAMILPIAPKTASP